MDTEGNEIKASVIDTSNGVIDSPYSTLDHKLAKVVTKDGAVYILLPEATEGIENGQIIKGERVITYVYKK